ncbi:hypothetical protein [Micromonospora sonchi]|nr:hypothetical protein [Micromonospora sonchi]
MPKSPIPVRRPAADTRVPDPLLIEVNGGLGVLRGLAAPSRWFSSVVGQRPLIADDATPGERQGYRE